MIKIIIFNKKEQIMGNIRKSLLSDLRMQEGLVRKWFLTFLLLVLFTGLTFSVSYAVHEEKVSSSEAEIMMKMLLKKGIITQEEYDEVISETEEKAEKQKEWRKHVDKHITHMEDVTPRFIDGVSIAAGITAVGQGRGCDRRKHFSRS
jgi:hypothetical protein